VLVIRLPIEQAGADELLTRCYTIMLAAGAVAQGENVHVDEIHARCNHFDDSCNLESVSEIEAWVECGLCSHGFHGQIHHPARG